MKHAFVGIILMFAGILAIISGQRLGMDAMAVVIGIVIGVIASIPASIIFALVTRQLRPRKLTKRR